MSARRRQRPTAASFVAWTVLAVVVAVGQLLDSDEPADAAGVVSDSLAVDRHFRTPFQARIPAFATLPPAPPAPPADRAERAERAEPPRPRRTLPQPFAAIRSFASPLITPRLSLGKVLAPRLSAIEGLASRARPGEPVAVTISAYCLQGITRRGREVRPGIIAADPRIFPLAHHVELFAAGRYLGKFLVDDTGARIRGTRIDIWTPDCDDARRFGMRQGVATLVAVSER